MTYPDKFVNRVEDVPNVEHWAIVKTGGVYIPGDERSRTNPGHGYPAHTANFLEYEVYLTEEKLLQVLKEMGGPNNRFHNKPYKVIKVTPVKIETEVKVSLKS